MSYEVWGEPPEREPQTCLLCGEENYLETCPLCKEVKRANTAEELLKRAVRQLEKWQSYYGKNNSKHLPPSGDVRLAEDTEEFLTHNAELSGPQSGSA